MLPALELCKRTWREKKKNKERGYGREKGGARSSIVGSGSAVSTPNAQRCRLGRAQLKSGRESATTCVPASSALQHVGVLPAPGETTGTLPIATICVQSPCVGKKSSSHTCALPRSEQRSWLTAATRANIRDAQYSAHPTNSLTNKVCKWRIEERGERVTGRVGRRTK